MEINELSKEDLTKLAGLFLGETFVHYGLWFSLSAQNMGVEDAVQLENLVIRKYFPRMLKRLAPHFRVKMDGPLPTLLKEKSREELILLIQDTAKTWLAGDGIWFQEVEASLGMERAKQVNDACWTHFSVMEAFKIRRFLGLGRGEGLEALERALKLRIYSSFNAHSSSWDEQGRLLWEMAECRVQSTRRSKGMEDYPCKSAGVTEYSGFARGIDPRIETQCVYCPPDSVPAGRFCMWRFSL